MKLVSRTYDLPNSMSDLQNFKGHTAYGIAHIHGKQKPIYAYREIKQGHDKGKLECIYLKKAYTYAKISLPKKLVRLFDEPRISKTKTKLVKRR